ncbi:Ubiquitin carboxyl-terminal hydrolase 30, partial [Calypte anna]
RYKVMKNWGVIGGVAAAVAAGMYVLWGPMTERKRRRRGLVPGLLNLGNTCFMNSLLQGLSSCPSFIKWLEEFTAQYRTEQPQPSEHQYLSVTLLHLLRALSCQEAAEDDDVLDASCLLEVLRMYRWQISSFEEQDAHELFHVLTSSLEDERDRQPRVTHLFDVHSLEQPEIKQKQIICRTRGSLPPVSSHWKAQHPFHGRLTSNMVCKHCEHQSPVRYDTFDSLSLSIPAAVWGRPMTLDHCLHHFISSESVKDVVCDNCTKIQAEGTLNGQSIENQRTTFVKQLKLGKKEFLSGEGDQALEWAAQGSSGFSVSGDLSKEPGCGTECHGLGTTGGVDQGLDLMGSEVPSNPANSMIAARQGVFCSKREISAQRAGRGCCMCVLTPLSLSSSSPVYLYRLMAVVVHHGDMHSGHFVTYRRSPASPKSPLPVSSQWLWVSDDTVRRASLQEVLSSSAYLLFYERVQSRVQHQ